MSEPIQCFAMDHSGVTRLYMTRHSLMECEPGVRHSVSVLWKEAPSTESIPHTGLPEVRALPEWPKSCGCGRKFTDKDGWLISPVDVFIHRETGEKIIQHDFSHGAIFPVLWHGPQHHGPDGQSLAVHTPGGTWFIDAWCKKDGKRWNRTGEIPNITVDAPFETQWNDLEGKPHKWCGELKNGVLTELIGE